jgi:hypothetical protein
MGCMHDMILGEFLAPRNTLLMEFTTDVWPDEGKLPEFANHLNARFPNAPEDLKPSLESMYVQFVKRKLSTGYLVVYGVVLDKRKYRLTQPSAEPTRPPLEIVYAISEACLGTFEAAWTLIDAVLWKQVAGQNASLGYLANITNLVGEGMDEWGIIPPSVVAPTDEPATARRRPRAMAVSVPGGRQKGNSARRPMSPPGNENAGSGSDDDVEVGGAFTSSGATS